MTFSHFVNSSLFSSFAFSSNDNAFGVSFTAMIVVATTPATLMHVRITDAFFLANDRMLIFFTPWFKVLAKNKKKEC